MTENQTDATRHPNVQLIARYYSLYAAGDIEALRRDIFAPDITWHIPGHHPLAGTKHGIDEVVAFFEQLAKANFKAEPLFLEANGEYVVDYHRGWGERDGASLDIRWCLVFQIREGRIVHAENFAGDQHAADAFFWAAYPLKSLPDRLAASEE